MNHTIVAIIRRALLALLQKIDTPKEQGVGDADLNVDLEQSVQNEAVVELERLLAEGNSLPAICAKVALPVRIVVVCRDLTTTAFKPGEGPISLNCRTTVLAYSPMGDAAPEDFSHLGIHDPPSEVKTLRFVNAETMRLLTGVIHHN